MTGRVSHFEIPYDDAERAYRFYREAFGWSVDPLPELDYTLVATGPTTEGGVPVEPGFIGGGMLTRRHPVDRPVLTVVVDDLDAALAAVTRLGGRVVAGPDPVGDFGRTAYVEDSEGNLLNVFQDLGGQA